MHPRQSQIPFTSQQALACLTALFFFGCGTPSQNVHPDDMSAERHRQEAANDEIAASRSSERYNPYATRPSPFRELNPTGTGDPLDSVSVYNPTIGNVAAAERQRQHARQHREAAQSLERFEEKECRGIAPEVRASCPLLGPAVELRNIDGGVRVRFPSELDIDKIVALMRCHFAFAQTRGFEGAAGCPLYMRGIEIRRAPEWRAVDIVSADRFVVPEIRARAREQVLLLGGR
ncbi:MAG TPA: hypothetical protein VH374_21340 [Polyangia bacterium]|jgi:hypothetical protein|nr:hypothetical protein [Polyangia bacterium]